MSQETKNALKSAAYTFLWTFIGVFGLSLAGWLGDLTQWATDDGGTVVFPDPTVLVKAAVAAVAAGSGFVVAAVIRLAQSAGWVPGEAPQYPNNQPD